MKGLLPRLGLSCLDVGGVLGLSCLDVGELVRLPCLDVGGLVRLGLLCLDVGGALRRATGDCGGGEITISGVTSSELLARNDFGSSLVTGNVKTSADLRGDDGSV